MSAVTAPWRQVMGVASVYRMRRNDFYEIERLECGHAGHVIGRRGPAGRRRCGSCLDHKEP